MFTRLACSIQLKELVIITGGKLTANKATVYNTEGWVEDLPSLNMGRYSHGCGHFVNMDNQVVSEEAIQYIFIVLSTHDDITNHHRMSGVPSGRRVDWLPYT